MKTTKQLYCFLACALLAGCTGYGSVYDVAKPTDVTVDAALKDVGSGLVDLKKQMQANHQNNGLLLDEVTVDLNLTASATHNGSLTVNASAPVVVNGSSPLTGNATTGFNDVGSRTNHITVKFKNLLTAGLNDLGKTDGKDLVNKGKIGTFSVPFALPPCPKDMACTTQVPLHQ